MEGLSNHRTAKLTSVILGSSSRMPATYTLRLNCDFGFGASGNSWASEGVHKRRTGAR